MKTILPELTTLRPKLQVTLLELSVLLIHILKAKRIFEHPEDNFLTFFKRFDQIFTVDKQLTEEALYYVKQLQEVNQFDHPFNKPFNQMVLDISKRNKVTYNDKYGDFERNYNDTK